VLIEREQPARCDLLVDDVVQADGRPAMVDVADRGESVGKRGESVSVADENVSSLQLKRVIGEVSSLPEVVEYLPETAVGPGDAIVARDARPVDFVRQVVRMKGSSSSTGPEDVSRRSTDNWSRSGGILEPARESGPSQPSCYATFSRIAQRMRAAREELYNAPPPAISAASRWKSPPTWRR
jgi:hypothetical protein